MESILITGGAGFFGRAFARKALSVGFHRVCIYSRDEHKHALMCEQFGNDERLRFFVGCVRDRDRLRRAMNDVDIVVHAAALKRIQTGFYDPTEMVRTNVVGAINVIEASMDARVKKVVALSSDKAFEPISAYGHSKAMAESLFTAANNMRGKNGPIFSCVRYGNVWNSTSSIFPTWKRVLQYSDTVPVTDPGATRFFMTIDQAVDLVLKTIDRMVGKEIILPDFLPAFSVGDLALAMDAKMHILGLGEFEKKHESMAFGNSSDKTTRMSIDELRKVISETA